MKNESRKIFNVYRQKIAKSYGVSDATVKFSVEPSIAQALVDKVTEKSDFLQKINVVPVSEVKGQKLFGSATGSVTGRTNTEGDGERKTKNVMGLTGKGYELHKTDSDVHMSYAQIDLWAKFKDFKDRYGNYVKTQMALDKIKIGWHGTHVAEDTDIATYPMLQDVNIGWLQILRDQAPSQVFTSGKKAPGKIRIGEGGDYANLDAAVHDALQLIEPEHRGPDLVAIIGTELLAEDKAKLYTAQGDKPSEKEKVEGQQVIGTYGSLPAHTAPFFPTRGILITTFDNLSIYYQDSSVRRAVVDNHKKDRVEDYNSSNEGYVVETLEKAGYVESANVQLINTEGAWE